MDVRLRRTPLAKETRKCVTAVDYVWDTAAGFMRGTGGIAGSARFDSVPGAGSALGRSWAPFRSEYSTESNSVSARWTLVEWNVDEGLYERDEIGQHVVGVARVEPSQL